MPLLFSLLFNDLSAWFIIPCLILGFGFAWLLYRKSNHENKNLKAILFTARFILISLLAFLLLSPLLKSIKQRLEKPLIIIAQDASASIAFAKDKSFDTLKYHQDFKKLASSLSDNYDVKILNFGDGINNDFNFKQTQKQTDFSQLFNYIKDQYPNQNIGALILASDGIYNRGANPISDIKKQLFPIYTIALGDTIPKKDLIVSPINYNNLVYLGNDHEIEIPVSSYMAKGLNSTLKINTNDGQSKNIALSIDKDNWNKTFKINLETKKKGIQKIVIQASTIKDELTTENNTQTIFVEVLDGKEKILILADAPHPDISAIKQAIESNKNYEVKVAFADDLLKDIKDFGLIIFHNLPSNEHPINQVFEQTTQKSKWFIIGTQTNTSALSQKQNLLNVSGNNASQDYLAALNMDFTAFSLSDESKIYLNSLAPLNAPFGNYSLKNAGLVLLNQQIGNVKTNAPLLAFGNDAGVKTAILTGEGIWRWRLEDFKKNENHNAFDELISKSVQYLSAKNDLRKFRVYPIKTRFADNEQIILNAELYDEAYNLNNEPDVSIDLKSKSGKKYSFQFTKIGKSYQLNAGFLPADEYTFEAKTKLGKNLFSANGQFLIEQINIELMHTTANHQLLYNMANASGGQMVQPKNLLSLEELIPKNEKVKTISYEEKSYDALINLKWIFALIMLLLSVEWFLRKRNGAI
ncbi:hypothetical protein A5893_15980 [Pedobacter psychrophilus]|uniref:VWA domain-containing protein n=1 Tax=Pedobacter psychrophilus TaxID=1826909 RepID=A0A179DB63_9SPHI|nr:hypothetical protein [Pedobacter psychrophilus]OAQ38286.1 hypothetical protein A5893_15980 [Pedobacter psychrophilus]